MKKNYIKPLSTIENKVIYASPLCASPLYMQEYGFSGDKTEFRNPEWYNEGNNKTGSFTMTGTSGLASQSKERGGDWGSIW